MSRWIAILAHEGIWTPARRKMSRAVDRLVERLTIRRLARSRWAADGRPVFLLLTHRAGGGTERHVRELAGALRDEGIRPVLVRPSSTSAGGVLWQECDDRGRITWCRETNSEPRALEPLLDLLHPAHAHVHQMMGLPEAILTLLVERGVPYDVTVHDYHTICPRVNLIGDLGIYCGEPDAAGCNHCLARLGDDQGRPVTESISAWRDRSGRVLAGARRVFVPSGDAFRRMSAFPGLHQNLRLRPHPESLPEDVSPVAARLDRRRDGARGLDRHDRRRQGVRPAARLRFDARRRRLPLEFHVIGTTDCDRLPRADGECPCHGPLSGRRSVQTPGASASARGLRAVGLPRVIHVHTVGGDGGAALCRLF